MRDNDKQEIISIADRFARLGFDLYATAGTANTLNQNMIATSAVRKMAEASPNIIDLLDSGKISYVISTSSQGVDPARDSVKMRRRCVEHSIACLTALDTASALADCLESGKTMQDVELVSITDI